MDDRQKRQIDRKPREDHPVENPHRDSEDSVLEHWNDERQRGAQPVKLPVIEPEESPPDQPRESTNS